MIQAKMGIDVLLGQVEDEISWLELKKYKVSYSTKKI